MVQRKVENGQHRRTCKDQPVQQVPMEQMEKTVTMARMETMERQ
jgi:hypothetical protein